MVSLSLFYHEAHEDHEKVIIYEILKNFVSFVCFVVKIKITKH